MNKSALNQVCKTVRVGSQIWMAENLNIKTDNSWCYDNKESNCQKYGRLYSWDAAMKACPSGWHLPTREDFKILVISVGGMNKAGRILKSKTGWIYNGNGTDEYSFMALPAGYRYQDGKFLEQEQFAYFWSSTETENVFAYYINLFYGSDKVILFSLNKKLGYSVRCLKD